MHDFCEKKKGEKEKKVHMLINNEYFRNIVS